MTIAIVTIDGESTAIILEDDEDRRRIEILVDSAGGETVRYFHDPKSFKELVPL